MKFDFLGLKTLDRDRAGAGDPEGAGDRGRHRRASRSTTRRPTRCSRRGDAAGVFQFEGQGMRDCLRQMRVDRFEDLVAAVALYRPGPMANIPAYCARKHGEPWESPHPAIHDILARDLRHHGLPGAGDADRAGAGGLLARRAPTCCAAPWARRSARRWSSSARSSCEGATERGIAAAKAGEIFDLMEQLRRLRLQQVARRRLCAGQLPDRLAEGEPPGRLPRRLHDARPGQDREARGPHAGGDAPRHRGAAARHQPLRRRVPDRVRGRTAGRHPLRPRRGEARRRRRPCRTWWRRATRAGRSPASPTSPRAWTRSCSTRCRSRTSPRPAPSTGWSPTAPGWWPAPSWSCAAPRPRRRTAPAPRSACSAASGAKPEPLRLPDGAGLAAAGEARLRGGGGGLPPLGASARHLRRGAASGSASCPRPQIAERARAGGGAAEAGGHGGQHQGAQHPHRQPHGLGDACPTPPAPTR